MSTNTKWTENLNLFCGLHGFGTTVHFDLYDSSECSEILLILACVCMLLYKVIIKFVESVDGCFNLVVCVPVINFVFNELIGTCNFGIG